MRERCKVKIVPPNENCIVNIRALGEGLSVMGGEVEYLVCGLGSLETAGTLHQNKQDNRPFPSSPRPLHENEVKCSAFHMK